MTDEKPRTKGTSHQFRRKPSNGSELKIGRNPSDLSEP